MNKIAFCLPLMLLVLTVPLLAQELTLEKIMDHPRWIGAWPEEVRYGADGKSIVYLGHADPRGYEVVKIDTAGRQLQVYDTETLPSPGHTRDGRTLYAFDGDLYLEGKGSVRLTQTAQEESEARWLSNHRIVYRADDLYFVRDLSTGLDRQVAELAFDDPKSAPDDFRSRQQDRLFPILKEREESRERRAQQKDIPRFYLGDKRELVRMEVGPDERFALLVDQPETTRKRDQMPIYLNRDGSVTSDTLRAKVGAETAVSQRLSVLNLLDGTRTELDFTGLPAWTADTKIWVEAAHWSRSGRLAVQLFSTNYKERWMLEVDLPQARITLVEHLHDPAWHTWDLNEFGWTTDNKLWYQSEAGGYAHLYLWDQGTSKQLTQGSFEVTSIQPDPLGPGFYVRANRADSGRYDVYRVSPGGQMTQVTHLGGQTTFDLSPDGRSMVLLHSSTTRPPEIYLQSTKPGAKAVPLTRLASSEFKAIEWVQPQFVQVPSSHQARPIRAKLYLPPDGVKPSGAAVMFVHGAGYLQNADQGWSYYFREFMFHSLLARRGVTVMDMDYRASAGYGRDWRAAIYRQMGTPELEDLSDGVSYLVKNQGVDPARIGVYGGSYGGFMTLMALFKEPELFACGAALRPVTDWAQYEHEYTARILNTPDDDPAAYLRSSPIEFAEGLKKPLLLCHGMLDDNVVAQDTVRLTQRLIQLKKTNWETALYPVEPHGFVEPESWLDEYRRILKLFEQNLRF